MRGRPLTNVAKDVVDDRNNVQCEESSHSSRCLQSTCVYLQCHRKLSLNYYQYHQSARWRSHLNVNTAMDTMVTATVGAIQYLPPTYLNSNLVNCRHTSNNIPKRKHAKGLISPSDSKTFVLEF